MTDFLKRNAPVLIIGLITLLVFVGIIAASQAKPIQEPTLEKVDAAVLITESTHLLGKPDAPVTIIEFSDFQCPACAYFYPVLKEYYQKNKDILRIGYRHFPLPTHVNARRAAEASEIAGAHGLFWEYAKVLFENQEILTRENLIDFAQKLGMNVDDFAKDLDTGTYKAVVDADAAAARELKLNATPTVFINGEKVAFTNFSDLTAEIDEALKPYQKTD